MSIYYNLEKYKQDRYNLLNTYNLDRLIMMASREGITIPNAKDNIILKELLIKALINNTIANITKPSKAKKSKTKKYKSKNIKTKYLRECPIIYNYCKKDYINNPEKYDDCLQLGDYQDCMVCFNKKIYSSNFINRGFKTSCDYKDFKIMCNTENPGTCKKDLMECPCAVNEDEELYNISNTDISDLNFDLLKDNT